MMVLVSQQLLFQMVQNTTNYVGVAVEALMLRGVTEILRNKWTEYYKKT